MTILPPNTSHLLSWQNIHLLLPADWNLSAFHGNARNGSLALSDLHGPRLAIRWQAHAPKLQRHWQSHPNPLRGQRAIQRLAQRAQQKIKSAHISSTSDTTTIQLSPNEQLTLAHDATRIFELRWIGNPPAPNPQTQQALLQHFLTALRQPPTPTWHWQVYGISAHLPSTARLLKASLLPGAPKLIFTHGKAAQAFGALSLADELLKKNTLRQLAQKFLHLNSLQGTWSQTSSDAETFTGQTRRLYIINVPIICQITHRPATNQILWQLTTTPHFLKIRHV